MNALIKRSHYNIKRRSVSKVLLGLGRIDYEFDVVRKRIDGAKRWLAAINMISSGYD
jgi:hypothetical protein